MGWWYIGILVGVLLLILSMGWALWVYRWRVMLGAAQREAERGALEAAEHHLQEALDEAVRRYGEKHTHVGEIWRFAVKLYRQKGQMEQARIAAKQALLIAEFKHGEDSAESASMHAQIAALAFEENAFREAEAHAQRALAIQAGSSFFSPMEVARTQVLLGRIVLHLQQNARALAAFEDALRTMEAHAEHAEVDQSRTIRLEMADLLALQQDDARALQILQPLLHVPESSDASEIQEHAEAFSLQSTLLSRQEQKQAARIALEKALALWKKSAEQFAKISGASQKADPSGVSVHLPREEGFARDLSRMAAWLQEEGQYKAAIPLYEEAIARLRKNLLDANKEAMGGWLAALGDTYRHTKDEAKAEAAYIEALEWEQASKGDTHPDVSVLRNNLASVYSTQGRTEEAEALFRLALRSLEAAHPQHPSISAILHNLGGIWAAKGQYEEADQAYQRALAVAEKTLGREHLDVANILEHHAALLRQHDEVDRAERLASRAKKIRRSLALVNLGG